MKHAREPPNSPPKPFSDVVLKERRLSRRLPLHGRSVQLLKLFTGKPLMPLGLAQEPIFSPTLCCLIRQHAQVRRLPCMVVGCIPRKRPQGIIVAHAPSPLL